MFTLIVRRTFWMIPTLLVISVISFVLIQLPPGDYLTSLIVSLEETGDAVDAEQVEALRKRYGLDLPMHVQYLRWLNGMLPFGFKRADDGYLVWFGFKSQPAPGRPDEAGGEANPQATAKRAERRETVWVGAEEVGLSPWFKPIDLGWSFEYERPVTTLIGERLLLTTTISIVTLLFTWIVAIPIGIYSAVRQYSPGDYLFTFAGFIGLATPNFLLALVLMYASLRLFGQSPGGLFSPEYREMPWSQDMWGKTLDLMTHIWIPVIIIGTAGTAGMIRVMRGNLLDELSKPYVVTARAKGVHALKLLVKYPVRVAINPMISTIGWVLPGIVSGAAITSVVLNLPTTGPLLLRALMTQDMYLAGSMVMMLAFLTVIGTLISDILLALVDPRIRYEGQEG